MKIIRFIKSLVTDQIIFKLDVMGIRLFQEQVSFVQKDNAKQHLADFYDKGETLKYESCEFFQL